ncbi:MAG: 3-phosphoshikimate 1-carboxyvinyltransferase [bacterium]|nr:3-phosphoshikimate 1-carboxyvinyltransferase [bacterium]
MVSSGLSTRIRAAREPLRGSLALSGDKSVSIRRALFALFSHRDVRLQNYGTGEDCQTALLCLEALGQTVERTADEIVIRSGPLRSGVTLDCRNSGTTARLLMGLLAGRDGTWIMRGDESLSRRPMARVTEPLAKMGARIDLADGNKLPARIMGSALSGCDHDLRIASAQVKSAVLLAGLHADGVTRVREPLPSRDHTERLLGLRQSPERFWMVDSTTLETLPIDLDGVIPGDISSAAFWAVAALLVPGSEIVIPRVLLNPLRAAWFDALRTAGADIQAHVEGVVCNEPVGTLRIRHSELRPLHVRAADVPGLIDEIPALTVLATTIPNTSRFEELRELRVKESDRLQVVADHLLALGVCVAVEGDDLVVNGGAELRGTDLNSYDDHRIAMAFALAGLVASGETTIHDADCAAVSYPEFFAELNKLTHDSVVMYNP